MFSLLLRLHFFGVVVEVGVAGAAPSEEAAEGSAAKFGAAASDVADDAVALALGVELPVDEPE